MMPATSSSLQAGVQAAEELIRAGKYADGLDRYIELLSHRVRSVADGAEFAAADLVIMERTADIAVLFGEYAAAEQLLDAYVGLAREAENDFAADYGTLKRIHIHLIGSGAESALTLFRRDSDRLGDLDAIELDEDGLTRFESALAWRRLSADEQAVLYSRSYLLMGRILCDLGQYGDAIATLDRGWTWATGPPLATATRSDLILARAQSELELGELDAAGVSLDAFHNEYGEHAGPGRLVSYLELRGKLHMLRGELGDALQAFYRVLRHCRAGRFDAAGVIAATNLAHVLMLLNQVSVATDLLAEAEVVAHRLGDVRAQSRVSMLQRLTSARVQSLADAVPLAASVTEMWGEFEREGRAETPFGQVAALDDIPPLAGHLALFEDWALGVHEALAAGEFGLARDRLDELNLVFGQSDSKIVKVRRQVFGAMVSYYQGNVPEADRAFAALVDDLDQMGLKPELWQVHRFRSWCAARLAKPHQVRQDLSTAADDLLQELAGTLRAEQRAIFLLNKWTADEEFLAAQVQRLVSERANIAPTTWYRRPFRQLRLMGNILRFRFLVERHRAAIAARAKSIAQLDDDKDPTMLSPIRTLLREQWRDATVSYLVLPDRLVVIASHRFSVTFGVRARTRVEVRELVRQWHEQAQSAIEGIVHSPGDVGGSGSPEASRTDIVSTASALSTALLIDEIATWLPRRVRAIRVVPDDCLQGVPWAALVHDRQFLAERYAVSTAYEATSTDRGRPRTDGEGALLVGVSRGTDEFPELVAVSAELDAVESVFRQQGTTVTRLEDSQDTSVSKEHVLGQLPVSRYIHMACHGVFEPDRPDESGLILVGSDGVAEVLALHDLEQLEVRAQHATLSSCWSADNFVAPGRWIVSLPETLCRAGAQSVLASLWPVHDTAGAAFVRDFYSRLATCSRRKALRDTQLACLRGELAVPGNVDTTHPLVWSAFQLYGATGRLAW